MPTIRGPEPLRSVAFHHFGDVDRMLSLANLSSSLVMVDNVCGVSKDLWFLMDSERSVWIKNYRLSVQQLVDYGHPLLVLDNGRVLLKPVIGSPQIYDPTAGTLTRLLEMRAVDSESIAVYTGSLLV
ncbi:hypothetical protein ACP4OV_026915 [Aristida adscensionis]